MRAQVSIDTVSFTFYICLKFCNRKLENDRTEVKGNGFFVYFFSSAHQASQISPIHYNDTSRAHSTVKNRLHKSMGGILPNTKIFISFFFLATVSSHKPHPYMVADLFLYGIGIRFIDFYPFLMEEDTVKMRVQLIPLVNHKKLVLMFFS